jgi:hypothetical protein
MKPGLAADFPPKASLSLPSASFSEQQGNFLQLLHF